MPNWFKATQVEWERALERQEMLKKSKEAWGEWLDWYIWDYYATFTFARRVGHVKAWKTLDFVYDSIGVEQAFAALEEGFDRPHLHSLLRFPMEKMPKSPRYIWGSWFYLAGICKVERYSSNKGAAYYCAKYVTKDLTEYKFYGNNELWKRERGVE